MKRKAWLPAALVAAAGAGVALASGLGLAFGGGPQVAGPGLAALGDPARCAAYAGLPPLWGHDAHAGMVRLPAGRFVFGSRRGYADERPADAPAEKVAAFWIDQTEVTNRQFAAFALGLGDVAGGGEGGAVVFHQPT